MTRRVGIYVTVHRRGVLAGQETLITRIETSDLPGAMHDFNLRGAGISTRPGVSRAAASTHGRRLCLIPTIGQEVLGVSGDVIKCCENAGRLYVEVIWQGRPECFEIQEF